ncbi:SPOR domain-containing protein [Defluviimonas sp. WL0075]|uniref:SPOR domain-containing protein n=1 Tax=Albidovulum sediminicola TaxID=2984331 RepID=A0ABT2Z5X7_9RHOB|nr:SPOR domain-containing protein [Defluviimonas sp. WL0075]MCV2866554.1 SPOR domain-containing protein [Defluviimonas sp. WL0075]
MPKFVRIAGALTGLAVLLSGCVGGTSPFGGGSDDATVTVQPPASRKVREEEREAPEAFSLTDMALWDGRPSLGGTWVAHTTATTPEKVIIRNTENGKSVQGALYRREREFPGPSIQMSSDAAVALGALAGQPVKISIVALRKVEVAEEPKPEAAPASDIETKAIDPVAATAAAAIAKAEAGSKPVARPSKAKTKAAEPVPAASEEKAKKPAKPAKMDAAVVAPKAAEQKPEAPKADAAPAPAAAPADEAPKAEAPAQDSAPLSGVLAKPYVQIGTFSSEDNAKRAALDLSKTGLSAVVRKAGEEATPTWRVIVGPALSAAERDALLERVKAAGYPDAFAVGG